jgi:hypothetical protein
VWDVPRRFNQAGVSVPTLVVHTDITSETNQRSKMKTVLLLAGIVTLVTGCYSKKEVVYERPAATRTTIVREPAGSVRVYEPDVRYRYYYPGDTLQQPKAGEYHVR